MLKIGLSGGIGSGKSTVAAVFAELGALIVDSDKIAREVVEPGTPGLAQLVEAFGAEILAEDGTLDRPKLAAKVFGDDEARAQLNAITHPLVAARSQELVEAAPPEQVVVRDIPLLVELGLAPFFSLAVIVEAPPEERLRRLTEARGMSEEDALARIRSQASDDARRAAADIVLDNSGSPEDLRARVRELWAERIAPFHEHVLARTPPPAPEAYVLAEPDPTWQAQAARLIARVSVAAGGKAVRADHIGSTAVPGLAAKNVIDLQLTVASLQDADELVEPLAAIGFIPVPGVDHDNPHGAAASADQDMSRWRKRFCVSADPGRPANLHLRVDGWPNQRFALLFRDWLRAAPAVADEYLAVKQRAAARARETDNPADGDDQVKEPWFATAYPRAVRWAQETGWSPAPASSGP
ncbi:dephospho-CoA kinase [Segniliparus rotundus DSM 44985]|uniref:Dephospho-CoA kinase n=1 Tax=Segniliparus rotundus (strain ATCC BAA-972 / CDC 1076 / CIP 108378 / DSM 44985 / JCM 13578) TaxID=640132 RepID=D6ZD81_SEGRD|nr:dephospho-CoA kinase [Segniliparus rotundus]ADG97145.1 dephospho-CoA kinase [Segniliparus rotundus DSM 44985]